MSRTYNRYLDPSPAPQAGHAAGGASPPAPRGQVQHRQAQQGQTQHGQGQQGHSQPQTVHCHPPSQAHSGQSNLLGEVTGGLGEWLGGMLRGFSGQELDAGDLLLVLIILLIFLEGDDLELVITLGLMLLLGLGDG